jgi:uncharacterized protein YfaS (alpha-2-macroglobulin family)
MMPREPKEHGLVVQRRLHTPGHATEAWRIEAGKLLELVVDVATPMDRKHVVVDVPIPAGLELVNRLFSNTETVPPVRKADGEVEDALDPLAQGRFDHVELRDDRLLLFASALPRGVHRYVVGVRAVTPGTFAFAPAKAEEMYSPEVFGVTDGSMLTVTTKERP